MQYQTVEESRNAGIAYHLAPVPVWEFQKQRGSYLPEAFEQDGFIHATNGLERLLWVANQFYTADDRPQTVLVLDVSKLTSELRYDDPDRAFPHIYGSLNTDAVIGELAVRRGKEGTFLGFGGEENQPVR
jgi:uncharacterized protein (DUF952 family)